MLQKDAHEEKKLKTATVETFIVSLVYVKNKKAVDLKLQHRINRNNSFSRY